MHEYESIVARIVRLLRLHSDIEEADPIVQLVFYADGLAAYGGERSVVCR